MHDVYMRKPTVRAHKKPRFPVTKMRLWREDREITLEEAGEAVGLSHAQLSRIELGHQDFKHSLVIKLADLYETDTVSLLERDPKDARSIWGSISAANEGQLKDIEKYADFVVKSRK